MITFFFNVFFYPSFFFLFKILRMYFAECFYVDANLYCVPFVVEMSGWVQLAVLFHFVCESNRLVARENGQLH